MTERDGGAPSAPDDGVGADECIGRRLLFGARSDVLVEVDEAVGVGKAVAGKLVAAGPRSAISAVEAAMDATVEAALGVGSEAAGRGRGALDWSRKVVGRQIAPPEGGGGAEQRE